MNYRKILILSLPSMLAVGLEPVAELIDTIFLGQKNTLWVSGLGATNSILISLTWVFNFLSYGVTARIGRAFGSRDFNQIGSLLSTALLLSFTIGIILSLPLLLSDHYILSQWYNLKNETLRDAKLYWNIRLIAYPLTLISMTLIGILRGLQKIRATLWIVASNTIVNALFTYSLVFPMDIGIQGAAIGTVCGFFISTLLGLFFVYQEIKKHSIPLFLQFNTKVFIHFGKDAIHLFARTGLLTLSFFILTIAVAKLGPFYLASHQIALQLWLFSAFLLDGFAIIGTSYGSPLLGQKKFAEFRDLSKKLFILGILTGILISLIFVGFKGSLFKVFSQDPKVHLLLGQIFLLLSLSQPLNAMVYISDGLIFASSSIKVLRNGMLFGFFILFLPIVVVSYYWFPKLENFWWALIFLNCSRLFFSLRFLGRGRHVPYEGS